ncbi:integrase, catalytic region, zinc finger, CCHC-type containing protein [Tanacetum coccineum]
MISMMCPQGENTGNKKSNTKNRIFDCLTSWIRRMYSEEYAVLGIEHTHFLVKLTDVWKAGCRKIIALDSCFLKKPNQGEILTAIERDGNNHIYPVAWAMVNVENKDNLNWFLELLEQDLGCSRGNGPTLMQHARHIYENYRKQYLGLKFRQLFWAASKASYPQLFNKVIDKIKSANPNAHKYLIDKNPKSWSRAFFEVDREIGKVEGTTKVRSGSEGFTVDEGKRTCSCRMWQLSGIPYVHAIKAILKARAGVLHALNYKSTCREFEIRMTPDALHMDGHKGVENSIDTQTCELSKEEFNDFLTLYPIPFEYHVILPKSNQTIFDAPPGFIYLGLTLLVAASSPLLLSCARLMVLSPLSTSSEEMAFRNFIYAEDDEDLSFLPKEPSPCFDTGSPSISVNTEPLKADEELVIQPTEIKDRKCKTRGGSSRPPVKRKLAPGSLASHATYAKTSSLKDDVPYLTVYDDDEGLPDVLELKDATARHLKISAITPPTWKNHLDNHIDVELLDLHDLCYARQAVVDNTINRMSYKLLQVIDKLRSEFDVIKDRVRAREEECEELGAKCEAAMTEFKKNPTVVALQEKISTLSIEFKEHKASLNRIMLKSQKWAGYQQSLSTLELKVTSLEAEKARLEVVKVFLQKEVDELKQDRIEVVSKVVPYAVMNLVHSDDMGSLIGRLISFVILYVRCRAYEQVADIKEPFDLSKVKGYHSSYKKDHIQANNDLATPTFPWLDEFMADPLAPIEALLSKKPLSLQRHAPSRTQVPLPSS